MPRFRNPTGTIVDTAEATATWQIKEFSALAPGEPLIQTPNESPMTLYRNACGAYYVVTWSPTFGQPATAEVINRQQAIRWLKMNNHELPEELANYHPLGTDTQ